MAEQSKPSGPDLTLGIPVSDLADGAMLQGHAGGEAVLLARRDDEYFAIGAACTHYGGPLAEGLMIGDTVRCPWHHACFNLRTGEALRPPALNPVSCWNVERRHGKLFVREKAPAGERRQKVGGAGQLDIDGEFLLQPRNGLEDTGGFRVEFQVHVDRGFAPALQQRAGAAGEITRARGPRLPAQAFQEGVQLRAGQLLAHGGGH